MDIRSKISENIVQQMVLQYQVDDISKRTRQLEIDRAQIVGAMNLLKQMYEEETGKNLQHDLNTNQEWKEAIKAAEQKAAQIISKLSVETEVSSTEINTPVQKQPDPSKASQTLSTPQTAPTPLRSVSENRSVKAQAQVEQTPTKVVRTREPAKIVINDEPITDASMNDDEG